MPIKITPPNTLYSKYLFDKKEPQFIKELEQLINKYSRENKSNTPDFILAEFIVGCLDVFDHAVRRRDKWDAKDYDINIINGETLKCVVCKKKFELKDVHYIIGEETVCEKCYVVGK